MRPEKVGPNYDVPVRLRGSMKQRAYLELPALLIIVLALIAPSLPVAAQSEVDRSGANDAITDVPGVRVGHYTVREGTLRGTTAILFDGSGIAGMDVRGGNPVTLGDSIFNPVNIGEQVDAVVLSGGSFFGLASVSGVVDYLYEHGQGVQTAYGIVPIVPAAVIFDLRMDNNKVHPTRDWGYEAAKNARGGKVEQGNVGAGAGGTVGKIKGGIPLKGGLGTSSLVLKEGVTVGVMVVLNSLGDLVNPQTGELYAVGGGFDRMTAPNVTRVAQSSEMNTTLVLVATDAELNKPQLTKIAQMVHDGLARAIRPVHTMLDGDTVFAVSVGWSKRKKLNMPPAEAVDRIGTVASDILIKAIINGLNSAESVTGFPSYRDWLKTKKVNR
jgi:L-aminopeptidase/D-esterase-like protein